MIVWGLFLRLFARLGHHFKINTNYLLGIGCESLVRFSCTVRGI